MSMVSISPASLHGNITVPASKSFAHRAIICAALAKGKSVIKNIEYSDDIIATLEAVEALGAGVTRHASSAEIDGSTMFTVKSAHINAHESGSTLRFMLSIASLLNQPITFSGQARLPLRPLDDLLNVLSAQGVKITSNGGKLPLTLQGRLLAGDIQIAGNVSSQYITGLLMALPLLEGNSTITLTSPLQSKDYITITIDVLKSFGIHIEEIENGWKIEGNQTYKPMTYVVEGDWSQAAFWLVGAALNGDIRLHGLSPQSVQGDREIYHILKKSGVSVAWDENILICKKSNIAAQAIDASQIPDLVPILSVLLSFANGTSYITNAARARIKESDRLQTTADNLQLLGSQIAETEDGLTITGTSLLNGGTVKGYQDHRIVMAMAIAALRADSKVIITDAKSINKSYPHFFNDYEQLGGKVQWVQHTDKV